MVTRHRSVQHNDGIRGISLITLLWTDGNRKIHCDDRGYNKADGESKHDHFCGMVLMAKAHGFSPKHVPFDG